MNQLDDVETPLPTSKSKKASSEFLPRIDATQPSQKKKLNKKNNEQQTNKKVTAPKRVKA